MKLRRTPDSEEPSALDNAVDTETVERPTKGRPTPKRREATPNRQPVTAPRTNKEATQWRKRQAAMPARPGSPAKLTNAELRAARARGDARALPRRDQGEVRQFARDWVDTHRMASNYLLILFPLLFLSTIYPPLNLVTIVGFVIFVLEWLYTGRRIHRIVQQRFPESRDSALTLGLYAGTRAYMPRKMRIPKPRYTIGDTI